jgi:AraC-like DNA-binding protein
VQNAADMTRINAPTGGYELGGYREYAVPPSLRHVAEVAWTYAPPRGRGGQAPAHRVLPETGISLCFISDRTTRGAADLASLTVMGPIRTVRQFVPEPAIHMEGVRLKPECARWLLGIDAGEYADVIDADTLAVARKLPLLRDRLAATTSERGALRLLFQAIEQGTARQPTSQSYEALVRLLDNARLNSATPATELLREMRPLASERHLRRLVREATGSGLKYFQRVLRLLQAVSLADAAANPRWARVAAASGYYDQAHLVNDFRDLTWRAPGQLHAERRGQWVAAESANSGTAGISKTG